MKLETYLSKTKTDPEFAVKSRLLIVRNRQDEEELRAFFTELPQKYEWVRLSRCVASSAFIPSADLLIGKVKEAVSTANSLGKIAFVTGLRAILVIWNETERSAAFECIRDMMDTADLQFLCLINSWDDEIRAVFKNPRYENGRAILVVGETPDDSRPFDIRLLGPGINKHIDGNSYPDLKVYLSDLESGIYPSQTVNITVHSEKGELANINETVRRLFDAGDFLHEFHGYMGGIGTMGESWLFKKMTEANAECSVNDFIRNYFSLGELNELNRFAPKMIVQSDDPEREILIWYLKNTLKKDSYLYRVLSDEQFEDSHFPLFYVNEAVKMIGCSEEKRLARERSEGIAGILQDNNGGLDIQICDFIEQTRTLDPYQVIPWLTNRTRFEIREVVRRLRQSDLKTLPEAFYNAFPLIRDYLAPYSFEDPLLNSYFEEYRQLKILNKVTESFYEKAGMIDFPINGLRSRDDLLKEERKPDVVLLIVDALGAEYLPMILSLSKKSGFDVAKAQVAMARIPTSTQFNSVNWPDDLRLPEIKDLDNIIHNGVHPHAESTIDENFIGMLEVFSEHIIPAIGQALVQHKRVVLTADHGASRLAVLAYQAQLAKTLPFRGHDEIVDDWRYISGTPGGSVPDGVTTNLTGEYWVVKGYDRFAKSGGKANEIHGGFTREEVLVPFVVFEKGAVFTPKVTIRSTEQFTENPDFDL